MNATQVDPARAWASQVVRFVASGLNATANGELRYRQKPGSLSPLPRTERLQNWARLLGTFADRLASAQISGKRKRGAAEVAPDEKVLTIKCDDGSEFPLRPGVRGRVLELGARLAHSDLSTRAGYVLILQSSAKEVARLLGAEEAPR